MVIFSIESAYVREDGKEGVLESVHVRTELTQGRNLGVLLCTYFLDSPYVCFIIMSMLCSKRIKTKRFYFKRYLFINFSNLFIFFILFIRYLVLTVTGLELSHLVLKRTLNHLAKLA